MSEMYLNAEVEGSCISSTITGSGAWTDALDLAKRPEWWRRVSAGEEQIIADYGENIDVPPSIAIIPTLMNVLPFAWLTDTTVHVDEIDAHFAAALPFIKSRYQRLYPELEWKGRVRWETTVFKHADQYAGNALALFSGGVDAVFTALANIAIEPTLVTVWGADMFFHDVPGWNRVKSANKAFADSLGLDFMTVKSTLRTCVNYAYLDSMFGTPVRGSWWNTYQVGTALTSLMLPAAFSRRSDTVYLASSNSKKDAYFSRSSSDPALVQEIRAAGIGVKVHDYSVSRQNKVQYICDFSRANPGIAIPLHVCWQESGGVNCGKCEKCLRTQFAIMGCGSDPAQFGFDMSAEMQDEIIGVLKSSCIAKPAFWRVIVDDLRDSKFKQSPMVRALLDSQAA